MLPDLICIIISVFFCVLVVMIHYYSIGVFYPVLMKEKYSDSCTITSNVSNVESSLWCNLRGHTKLCSFKNLCYVPKENLFVFSLTNNSVFDGINNIDELKEIVLSSVMNHNRFSLKLAVISQDSPILRRNKTVIKHGFILWRFKWDNIMHVIHDDLLPLHTTYSKICKGNIDKCVSKYQLAFVDEGEHGSFIELYNMFSRSEPLLLRKIDKDNLICFDDSRVGLSSDSVWFQYGFGIPQGPVINSQLNGKSLRQFSQYILEKYAISNPHTYEKKTAVFFSRKINRKILNEVAVMNMIEDTYKTTFDSFLTIHTLDFATDTIKTILTHVSQSNIVIGMHGSAMIFSIFLKPGSVVVELFPFGINPDNVSPLKALCQLPDIGLIYNYWKNKNETNTITNPHTTPLLGGIVHLSSSEQYEIMRTTEIPAVECCHNPAYLYRMFQDTVVGEDFIITLKTALQEQKSYSVESFYKNSLSEMQSLWYFPAPVTDIFCKYSADNQTVNVVWTTPINSKKPQYQIAVVSNIKEFSTTSKKSEITFLYPSLLYKTENTHIDIWIKSTDQGKDSLDSYFKCIINNNN